MLTDSQGFACVGRHSCCQTRPRVGHKSCEAHGSLPTEVAAWSSMPAKHERIERHETRAYQDLPADISSFAGSDADLYRKPYRVRGKHSVAPQGFESAECGHVRRCMRTGRVVEAS